ncbi:MAG: prepilin peptidase [Roseburia sp.]
MLKSLTLLLLLGVAVWMDVQKGKISNRLIVFGIGLGLMFQITTYGVYGVFLFLRNISFPVILFYLLFLMHALGAGDIKLFSMIGSFLSLKGLCHCIGYAFFTGAVWSLLRLLHKKKLKKNLMAFGCYIKGVISGKQITRYGENREEQEVICFSIPILCGYLCYLLEVMY